MSVRGRRPELPVDTTVFDGPDIDLEARVAWLLRVSRLASDDPEARRLRPFAARLGEAGFLVDHTAVSHWENAARPVPAFAFAGYEQVLGLPRGQLRGAVEMLRAGFPGTGTPPAPSPWVQPQQQLDLAFERTRSGHPAGGDWLLLADVLTGPDRVLVPTVVLEELVGALLGELVRAVGSAYTSRFQALRALLGGPGPLSSVVLAAIEAAVAEPGAQVVYEPISLRGELNEAGNVRGLVALLGAPEPGIRTGATHAVANLLITRTFPGSAAASLEARIADLLTAGPAEQELGRMLLPQLPLRSIARVQSRLRSRLRSPLSPAEAEPAAGTPQPDLRAGQEHDVVATLCACVLAAGTWPEDAMLARLLRESLFSRRPELRHHAGLLLAVTPYAQPLGTALVAELDRTHDPVSEDALSWLLSYVAAPCHTDSLKGWLADPAPRRVVAGLRALAHSGSRFPDVDLAAHLGGDEPTVAQAALYAAGMSGHPVLAALAGEPTADRERRAAAAWWLRTGAAVHDHPA